MFDDRELLVLGTGAAVICGLIFVLGFLVGQGIEQNTLAQSIEFTEPPPPNPLLSDTVSMSNPDAPEILDDDQEPLPENEPVQTSGESSYFKVLPDREEYVQVEATPVKEMEPAAAELEEDVPEPVAAEAPAEPAAEQPASTVAAATPVAPQNPVAAPPVLPNVPRSPTDEMHVGRPAAGANQGTAAGFSGTVYSVQVASSPSYEDSERLQQKFIALGYESFVMTADLGDKGIWYRVRVGNLPTRDAAEQMQQDILNRASHLAKDPYVIKFEQ